MATFDVNTQVRKVSATANGSLTDFDFSFQVNATTDIDVFVDSVLQTSGFSIVNSSGAAGLNTDGTGTVKFSSAPSNGSSVAIKSDVPLGRTSVYTSGGNITAASLEADFDTTAMKIGDADEAINRSLKAPVGDPDDISMTIPAKASRLDKVLAFNSSTGNPEVRDYVTVDASAAITGVTAGTVSASKMVQVDANKDITGFRNVTISGDADIDGTLEADAITVNGTTLAETISDTVGAMVTSNTETGLSVTYDDSDNTLDFVIGSQSITNSMLADDAVGADELASSAVVTDSIVDDAVTLDKMAGLARGKIIVGDASGNPVALALGSSGEVLKSDGTDLVFGTATTGATALDDLTAGDAATTLRTTAGNITIKTEANDTDIILEVDDAGTQVTGLKIDGSEAAQVQLPNDAQALAFGADQDVTLTHNHNVGLTLNSKDLSGVASVNSTSTGTRNYILNSSFDVAQRGQTINATTPISGANNSESYCLDQWIIVSDGNDIIDVAQSTTAPTGSTHSIQLSIETANKKAGVLQWLEASQCQNLIGKTVTLSFQAKSSDAAVDDFRAVVLSWDGTADAPDKTIISSFGSEGSNPTYNTNVTAENTSANLNLSTSFQKFSITCDIDTSGAKNVGVYIFSNTTTGLSTGENIFISQVQLEVGSTATEYVHEDYSTTFLKCARYFRGWLEDTSGNTSNEGPIANGHNMTGSGARINFNNPVPLRVTPTIDQSSIFLVSNGTGDLTSLGTIDSVGVGQNSVYFIANHNGSSIPNGGQVIVFLKEGQGGLARFFLSCELGA